MTIYDRIVQLLRDWPLGCPVKPEWRRIEATLSRGQCFAKSIKLSEESRPDRLVFYTVSAINGLPGPWNKNREIIAVRSYNHGVQVWEAGTDDQASQAVRHMREALARKWDIKDTLR